MLSISVLSANLPQTLVNEETIEPWKNISSFRIKWQYQEFHTYDSQCMDFYPWQIHIYHKHLSIHSENYYCLKSLHLMIFCQIIFKVNFVRNGIKLNSYTLSEITEENLVVRTTDSEHISVFVIFNLLVNWKLEIWPHHMGHITNIQIYCKN